jgi:hypothetical protein
MVRPMPMSDLSEMHIQVSDIISLGAFIAFCLSYMKAGKKVILWLIAVVFLVALCGSIFSRLGATAIFMESQMVQLPLTIPANSSIHVIPLNKKRMQTVKSGFYDIPNHGTADMKWPNETILKELGSAALVWRCDVTNNGPTTVLDVAIPITITFDNEGPPVDYTAVISPLEAGSVFSFYLVNDCSAIVGAICQENITLQVLGEEKRRQVRLHRKFRNKVEQIMSFFGVMDLNARPVGSGPCE